MRRSLTKIITPNFKKVKAGTTGGEIPACGWPVSVRLTAEFQPLAGRASPEEYKEQVLNG